MIFFWCSWLGVWVCAEESIQFCLCSLQSVAEKISIDGSSILYPEQGLEVQGLVTTRHLPFFTKPASYSKSQNGNFSEVIDVSLAGKKCFLLELTASFKSKKKSVRANFLGVLSVKPLGVLPEVLGIASSLWFGEWAGVPLWAWPSFLGAGPC